MMQPDSAFNPFPGLRPFQLEEDYLFFGREQQRQELISLLGRHRFIAVIGASGSGKSSLVRAGLLPALYGGLMGGAGSHWQIALMRPGGAPIRNLAEALQEAGLWEGEEESQVAEIETMLTRSSLGLIDAVRQGEMEAQDNLLVIVDQFEELFRFGQHQSDSSTRDEAAAFVRLLLEASQQEAQRIYVVLTMRSDFFGDCAQFEDLAERINQGEYLVPRLSREQKKSAIEGPIKVGGATLTPGLMQRLLNDAGEDPDQLPILQHALMRTWEHWRENAGPGRPLDIGHYESIGGIREALSRHADEVYQGLVEQGQASLTENIFKALTERGNDNRGIRRPTRLGHLAEITGATEGESRQVIEAFRRPGCTFLMPPASAVLSSGQVIDISHESLMRVWQRLRLWVEEEAQSARIYRRLAETAAMHREKKAGLYRDPDLQIALSWRQEEKPTEAWAARYHDGFALAMSFLDESAAASRIEEEAREEARQRELEQARSLAEAERKRAEEQLVFAARLRWLVRGLGLVAIIALVALVSALFARKEAQASANLAAGSEILARQNADEAQRQAASAAERAEEARESLVRLNFSNGRQLLEKGDTLGALPWFAEVLRLTEGRPGVEEVNQLRVNSILSRSPQLLNFVTLTNPISSFDWHPAGDRLALSHGQGGITVIDADDGSVLEEWPWAGRGGAMEFSPGGDLLALRLGSEVKFFSSATGELQGSVAHGASLMSALFSRDGQLVATSSTDGSARVWKAPTGEPVSPWLNHKSWIYEARLSPDSELVITTGYSDAQARLWEVKTGKLLHELKHKGAVVGVSFSPDGERVATAGFDQTAHIWDVHTGQKLGTLPHAAPISFIEYSDSGAGLVTGAYDGLVRFWNADGSSASSPVAAASLRLSIWGTCSADGRMVLGGRDRELGIWNVASGLPLSPPFTFPSPVIARLSPDGARLATVNAGDAPNTSVLRVWAWAGQKNSDFTLPHPAAALRAAFSEDGRTMAVSCGDGSIRFWNVADGTEARDPLFLPALPGDIEFSPDGEWLAAACADSQVRLWKLAAHEPSDSIGGLGDAEIGLRFNGNGEFLTLLGPRFAVIVDVQRGEKVMEMEVEGMRRGLISEDGNFLFLVRSNQVIRIDVGTGKEVSPALELPGDIESLVGESSGRLAVLIEGALHIVSAQTGKAFFPPLRSSTRIVVARFSKDGQRIGTGTAGRQIQVWNVVDGTLISTLRNLDEMPSSFDFNGNGSVVALSHLHTAGLWDADSGQPIPPLFKQSGRVLRTGFTPDFQKLYILTLDNTVKLVQMPQSQGTTQELIELAKLISGVQVDATGAPQIVPASELQRIFLALRPKRPELFTFGEESLARWHRREAASSATEGNSVAREFHLARLAKASPESSGSGVSRLSSFLEDEEFSIPARDPKAPKELLDLSDFYNFPMSKPWHIGSEGNDLRLMPRGVVKLAGVDFDVRGVVQLASERLAGPAYPEFAKGIPVAQKFKRLHLLHALGYGSDQDGVYEVVTLVLHYANGREARIPILKRDHLVDWWNSEEHVPQSTTAWLGTNDTSQGGNRLRMIRLFRTVFENPHPELEVISMDYISAMRLPAPFLLAATVEP